MLGAAAYAHLSEGRLAARGQLLLCTIQLPDGHEGVSPSLLKLRDRSLQHAQEARRIVARTRTSAQHRAMQAPRVHSAHPVVISERRRTHRRAAFDEGGRQSRPRDRRMGREKLPDGRGGGAALLSTQLGGNCAAAIVGTPLAVAPGVGHAVVNDKHPEPWHGTAGQVSPKGLHRALEVVRRVSGRRAAGRRKLASVGRFGRRCKLVGHRGAQALQAGLIVEMLSHEPDERGQALVVEDERLDRREGRRRPAHRRRALGQLSGARGGDVGPK